MARNGRPRKEIDWKEFESLCKLQCSILEMCQWFHISHQTLERRCREFYGETFGQVFEKKRVGGLISLRRNMFRMSEKQPAVAIFLAKNFLGMTDKQEVQHSGYIGQPAEELSDAELTKIILSRRSNGTAKEAVGTEELNTILPIYP